MVPMYLGSQNVFEVEKFWGHTMYFCGDELAEILDWMIRASVAIGCLWVGFGHGHLRTSIAASLDAGLGVRSVVRSGSTSIGTGGESTWTRSEKKRLRRQERQRKGDKDDSRKRRIA